MLLSFTIKCVSLLAAIRMIICGVHAKSYQVNEEQVPWLTAYQKCLADGMRLATITNEEENNLIIGAISRSSARIFWTSAVRQDNGNEFFWWNSIPVLYTKWKASEPDNFGNYENCISIHQDKGEWSDSNCYMKYGFICESGEGEAELQNNNIFASSNTVTVDGPKYIVQTEKESWIDAYRGCLSKNSHLVSIATEIENKVITEQVQQSEIIDDTNKLFWTSGTRAARQKDFNWGSSLQVSYTNWRPSSRSQMSGTQLCLAIDNNGKWKPQDCETRLASICEISSGGSSNYFSNLNDAVEAHETYYRKWYTLNPRSSTKKVAELDCASNQGHLLSISDEKEYESIKQFIYGRAPENYEFYTSGIYSPTTGISKWWTNKIIPKFLPWNIGYPNDDNCIIINYAGELETRDCGTHFNSICEYFEVAEGITADLIQRDCCKSEVSPEEEKVYHVINKNVDWNTALQECRNKQMRFATVRSFEESKLIQKAIKLSDNFDHTNIYWMGGILRGTWGRYEWYEQNKPLTFTNWGNGQPDYGYKYEICLINEGVVGWSNYNCNQNYPFICEEVKLIESAKNGTDCFTKLRNLFEIFYNELSENLKELKYHQHNC